VTDIFREVDEDLRRDQIGLLWKKYGLQMIAAFVAVVLVAGGVVAWKAYRAATARAASLKYQEVVQAGENATQKAPEERLSALDAITSRLTPGYLVLARFDRAAALIETHHQDEAIKVLDAIAAENSVDAVLRDVAQIKAAFLRVETVSFAEMKSKLARLAAPESAFRFSAAEILGYAAFRAGDLAAACTYYQSITSDLSAPADIRQRADDMLSDVEQRLPAVATPGAVKAPPAGKLSGSSPKSTTPQSKPQE
jgi:hypothetical protein